MKGCIIRTFLTLCNVATLAVFWNSPLQCLPQMRSKYMWHDPDKAYSHMNYGCHLHCCVQHGLYFKRFHVCVSILFSAFILQYIIGWNRSVNQSASTFSLKAKRGSVCYKLLVAGHEFVSTGCGTHLYHLSPAIFTVTSFETLCRPHHYVYPYVVSSNCSHISSFQNLCRITFGTQCFISKSNHPFLGLSLSLSFESHRNASLSLVNRAPWFQSYCPCVILLHHTLDVRKSVPHHTIQIIQPTRCNSFTSLLFDVYVWLDMFRASPRPSSGAYNCTRSLWFYRWREAAGALLVVVWPLVQPLLSNGKTKGS